jgi:hypothetical protein
MRLAAVILVATGGVSAETPFAARVIDYSPAPGQWVNDPWFKVPSVALGRPYAGGFDSGSQSSLVSLGGFGGSITLAFDHTVEDHPLNPFGMDAIVFSNAFWIAEAGPPDPNIHWAECATIEISLDENGNGEADDRWYLIPGSHIQDPAAQFLVVTWDDDVDDDTYPPPFTEWIPPGLSDVWTTQAYELPFDVFGPPRVVNPSSNPTLEGIFGYAEYSPTLALGDLDGDYMVDDPNLAPDDFYTVPDDPLTVGITPGSGGGDAFDIAWAIDPDTGLSADLPGFDFIRLTTAVNAVDLGDPKQPGTNEKSAEIDAVSDAAPDPFGDFDNDEDLDLLDVAALQLCFWEDGVEDTPCHRMDREPDGVIDLIDAAALALSLTGPR